MCRIWLKRQFKDTVVLGKFTVFPLSQKLINASRQTFFYVFVSSEVMSNSNIILGMAFYWCSHAFSSFVLQASYHHLFSSSMCCNLLSNISTYCICETCLRFVLMVTVQVHERVTTGSTDSVLPSLHTTLFNWIFQFLFKIRCISVALWTVSRLMDASG